MNIMVIETLWYCDKSYPTVDSPKNYDDSVAQTISKLRVQMEK